MDLLGNQRGAIQAQSLKFASAVLALLGAAAWPAHAQIVNGDFEDLTGTFPNGWTVDGIVTPVAGIATGSANAAQLDIGASLVQDFVPTSPGFVGFQLDYVMQFAPADPNDTGVNNANRLRLRGATDDGSGNLITMRLQPAGLQKFTTGFGWFTMISAVNFPSGSVQNNTPYYIRVVCGEFDGDPATEYQVFVSEDGVNYVAGPLVNSFHQQGVSSVDRPLEIARFDAGNTDSTIIDDVTVIELTISSTSWDGGGASNNWSDANNWVGDVAPDLLAGTELLGFSDDSLRSMPFNDIVGASIAGMAFNGPGQFTIQGNALEINNAVQNNASATQTIDTASLTVNAGTTMRAVGADIDVLSPATMAGPGLVLLFAGSPGGNAATLRFAGQVSGDADMDKRQSGILQFDNNANDFTSVLVIDNGTVLITSAGALGDPSGPTQVANNGSAHVQVDGAFDVAETFQFRRRAVTARHLSNISGATTLTGDLEVLGGDGENISFESIADTLTLDFASISYDAGLTGLVRYRLSGEGTIDVQNAIDDSPEISVEVFVPDTATGTYTLSNATNTYTARTVVEAGTLVLSAANNNNIPNSSGIELRGGTLDVSGLNGGTINLGDGQDLFGSGVVAGAVVCDPNTTLAPGDTFFGSGAGTLEITGGLTLQDGQTISLDVGLPDADLLRISGGTFTGASSVDGVTIELGNAGGVAPGTYTVIDWSGAGAVNVDLSDFVLAPSLLAEGASLAINGSALEVTITGGTVVGSILVTSADVVTGDRDFADEQTDFDGVYRYDVTSNGLFINETLFIDGTTCCGGGSFQLADPAGIAVDASGNIYVAERVPFAGAILQFSPTGSLLSVLAEEGNQFANGTPSGIAIDSSNPADEILYFTAGGADDAIYKVELDNGFAFSTLVAKDFGFDPNDPNVVLRSLDEPEGIAVLPSGNIVVGDTGSNVFREFDPSGNFIANEGGTGARGVDYDADYGRLLLTKNFSGGEVRSYFVDTLDGASSDFENGGLGTTFDVANIAGEVYVANPSTSEVTNAFGATAVVLPGASHILVESSVHGLDFDNDGTLIAEGGNAEDVPDFVACVSGRNNTLPPVGCSFATFQRADIDDDRDVDMNDVLLYQLIISGQ